MSFQDDFASLPGDMTIVDTKSNIGGGMMMTWGTGFQKGMNYGAKLKYFISVYSIDP